MEKLSNTGRIFYGIAMAVLGFLTIYYRDFPYMMIPPHSGTKVLVIIAYLSGILLILAGTGIFFEKKALPISLLLGTALLLIFCFYYVPYEFVVSSNYLHLGEWENAEKELALSAGAFVVAASLSNKNENALFLFLKKLIPFGAIFFSITIVSFGIDHFLYAKDAADYIPSWISHHLFWIYFAGLALIGAGLAIILKIRTRLFATLLGSMIFTWFVILHIPKAISDPPSGKGGEPTSAFLALAYSGIAFVIAGTAKKPVKK